MDIETIKLTFELLRKHPLEIRKVKIDVNLTDMPIYALPFQVRCYECYFTLRSNQNPFFERLERHEHEDYELILK